MKTRTEKELIKELKKINANLELLRQGWLHRIYFNFCKSCKRCKELKEQIEK